jgi:hypothetical protein
MTIGAQVKQCLASLKSTQAGLKQLALRTPDSTNAHLLLTSSENLEGTIVDLQKRVSELEFEEQQYKGF